VTDTTPAAWLQSQRRLLRQHVVAAVHPDGGFAWLDAENRPLLDRPVELWITARMTHVAALAVLEGDTSLQAALDHGVRALDTVFRDRDHGGWFAAVSKGSPTLDDKRAYEHAFVVLAASSATAAGAAGAPDLLAEALAVIDARFWREDDGLMVDVWDRTWTELEPYRGVNANMHSVEALLTASDVTGDPRWTGYAARIVERVVHGFAAGNGYRLPEHFTPDWVAVPDYNRDEPAHPFRPYGVTIGHLLEWSRLTLQTRDALGASAPSWMLPDAVALVELAVADGWSVDGNPGFVYTTDFEGRPVVRDRLHWVVAEGIGAAWALHAATGDPAYLERYEQWWAHARELFIDAGDGSWQHELDPHNQPASTVWEGRPDVYHAYQAELLAELDHPVSFAGALLHEGPPAIL
jgi:mannose/cellobiose epimerase-like protein (N-acyl-D-glucosamine 2-epimerase family)